MCKSLDILPLPKDDSTASQVGGLNLEEGHLEETKPEPEPQSSSKGPFSRATKKAGPKEWRKGILASMDCSRFSPRPNKQVKEVERKVPVKRNILSSLSNVSSQPHGNSTKLGGSRLRRAGSTLNVMGAGSAQKPTASTTNKQGRAPATGKQGMVCGECICKRDGSCSKEGQRAILWQ